MGVVKLCNNETHVVWLPFLRGCKCIIYYSKINQGHGIWPLFGGCPLLRESVTIEISLYSTEQCPILGRGLLLGVPVNRDSTV